MLALLLTLGLGATPAGRCGAIWSGIEQGKGFRQDVVADMLHGAPEKVATLRAHFLEGCARLPDADLACGEAHAGRALFRSCPALGQVFHAAATAPDVAGGAIAKLREEGLAREALANLRALGQAARLLRLQDGPSASFEFPKSTGPTPARDCCQSAEKTCAAAAKDWLAPTWKALRFAPKGPLRFRYSFESSGKGKQARFTARAEGDPDCNGNRQVWEVTGQPEGGRFTVADVVLR